MNISPPLITWAPCLGSFSNQIRTQPRRHPAQAKVSVFSFLCRWEQTVQGHRIFSCLTVSQTSTFESSALIRISETRQTLQDNSSTNTQSKPLKASLSKDTIKSLLRESIANLCREKLQVRTRFVGWSIENGSFVDILCDVWYVCDHQNVEDISGHTRLKRRFCFICVKRLKSSTASV